MVGLYDALTRHFGLEVVMVADGEMPKSFMYLPYYFKIQDGFEPQDFDTVVLLDCAAWTRTGWFEDDELNITWPDNLIVIDHHATATLTPGLHYLGPATSSTSEMVYDLLKIWDVPINIEIATALLTGICFDTGSFQHVNTSEKTLRIAADLMQKGANLPMIAQKMYVGKSVERLKLWGIVLQRMRYDETTGVTMSAITREDMETTGTTKEDAEGLVNLMNTVPGLKFSLLLSETPNGEVKGSLRTQNEQVDVGRLAQFMGGGGHARAAGFLLPIDIEANPNQDWRVI
jgi:phosphoesterase RecJ-like protein